MLRNFHFIHLMILSKQKRFLLLSSFSTESKTCTSVLQTKHAFLATRSMNRINVGLKLSYLNLSLLFSWKTYMCILKAWNINKYLVLIHMGTNRSPLLADFYFAMRGINKMYMYECFCPINLHKSKHYDLIDMFTIPLNILTIYSPSITLNLRNIFLIYIPRNFS